MTYLDYVEKEVEKRNIGKMIFCNKSLSLCKLVNLISFLINYSIIYDKAIYEKNYDYENLIIISFLNSITFFPKMSNNSSN